MSIVGPLALGGLAGACGAAGALLLGWHFALALVAYSVCGALGVLAGGALNMRAVDARAAPSPAPTGASPATR